jgi:hypothetical protein
MSHELSLWKCSHWRPVQVVHGLRVQVLPQCQFQRFDTPTGQRRVPCLSPIVVQTIWIHASQRLKELCP